MQQVVERIFYKEVQNNGQETIFQKTCSQIKRASFRCAEPMCMTYNVLNLVGSIAALLMLIAFRCVWMCKSTDRIEISQCMALQVVADEHRSS